MTDTTPVFDDSINRLQAAADALARDGATADSMMAALVSVMVTTARKSRNPVNALDTAAQVLMSSAERISKEPR